MGVESYKHQFAKATLAQWFREAASKDGYDYGAKIPPISWRVNRGAPNYGVWTEYPICLNAENQIEGEQAWDEQNWDNSESYVGGNLCTAPDSLLDIRPPSYDEVIAMGLVPIVIFDVAIQHKGNICYGFEVVHRHDVSNIKMEYLRRVGIETYRLDADWILSRVKRPTELVCQRII